jgi:predicted peroxiredoxin
MITVEDTIEILSGVMPRPVNIRIDITDIKIITSLGRQLLRNVALTDRQLELSLKKIEKYRHGLEQCGIAVDEVLTLKTLRMPIRELDRTQMIYLDTDSVTNKPVIRVKYVFSKKFAEIWANVEDQLTIHQQFDKNIKQSTYTEKNLYAIVKALSPLGFDVSDEIQEIYKKIEEILEKPENYVPYLDLENDTVVVRNVNNRCKEFLENKFEIVTDANLLEFINTAKNAGISLKSQKLVKKISEISSNDLLKKICIDSATRFRVSPNKTSVDDIASTINTLNQWPLVVVVEENAEVLDTVKAITESFSKFVPKDTINIFFRLKNEQKDFNEFNQFIKDNHLNNYIDSNTKVVFISRTRIPKPLLKADWKPSTAIITSNHDFGKLSAYLNDFSTVYYYNNSITMRNSRLKGADKIVQL